ncbi:MAG: hypothetical protein ACXVB0_16560 [Mucilaginibacter sp.]
MLNIVNQEPAMGIATGCHGCHALPWVAHNKKSVAIVAVSRLLDITIKNIF